VNERNRTSRVPFGAKADGTPKIEGKDKNSHPRAVLGTTALKVIRTGRETPATFSADLLDENREVV
jgi:hypothetical protein